MIFLCIYLIIGIVFTFVGTYAASEGIKESIDRLYRKTKRRWLVMTTIVVVFFISIALWPIVMWADLRSS